MPEAMDPLKFNFEINLRVLHFKVFKTYILFLSFYLSVPSLSFKTVLEMGDWADSSFSKMFSVSVRM